MANHAVLDNISHKDIKIISQRSADYGDNVSLTSAFISEFMFLQSWYPLFFRHNSDNNSYEPVALLGLKPGQNLFLQPQGWQAGYVPLSMQRQPFLIGFQQQVENGVPQQVPVVCIDLAHPRVSQTEGEPVFLPDGGNSPLLQQATAVLQQIQQGHQQNQVFCQTLAELQLLQSTTLELKYHGAVHKLTGLHSIATDKLNSLSAEQLQRLQRQGYLEAIYLMQASTGNIAKLLNKIETQAV
ncbi:MAG TPA: SapC family protein [Rheinheimera sp.]|nr:SapC family protein [Rheinheimera sp.]